MTREEFIKSKEAYQLKILVQQVQFEQWLKSFFYINHKLSEEYDSIYQETYYIKLYEILTEGLKYAEKVCSHLQNGVNSEKTEWYKILIKGLLAVKTSLSDDELQFIEYKRHNASHIFQNGYEVQLSKDGKIKEAFRKGENVESLNLKFQKIILKYGNDKNFDIYLTTKLNPNLTALFNRLT